MAKGRQTRTTPEPRSLPPETGLIDASWDDDVDIAGSDPRALFDRVTEVPATPPEEYVPRMMAAADAREAQRVARESQSEHDREEPQDYLTPPRVPVFGGKLPELPKQPPPPARVAAPRSLSESGLPIHGSRRSSDPPAASDDSVHRRRTRPEPRGSSAVPPSSDEFDELALELAEAISEPKLQIEEIDRSLEIDQGATSGGELAPMYADMKDRYAMGDFTGALVISESILEVDTEDSEAKRYAESCRNVLTQMYAARLGSLNQVVSVAIPADQIRWLSLDHRAGFLLSLVDGISTVEELLDISGMTRLEALRIMYTLLEQRVISVQATR